MRVLLSVESIRPPLTGIGRYTFELASGLPQVQGLSAIRFISDTGWVRDIADRLGQSHVATSARDLLAKSRIARAAYRALTPAAFRWRVRNMDDFVFHSPNFSLPPFPGASVATIHDLSILRHPEYHPPVRVRHMEKLIASTLTRASALIADSNYVRDEIVHYLGWPAERVHVVPLAPRSDSVPRTATETASLLDRIGLMHGRYSLCVATIEPRKNIDSLISAYEMLDSRLRARFPLVLAGDRGWLSDALHQRIKAAQAAGWLRYLGYVSDAHLPILLSGARLFVYPSLYEGFGLPIVEAMSSGVPVICADHPSLDEAAANAALRLPALDVPTMSQAIAMLLESDESAARLAAVGRAHAQAFSWQRTVKETADVYRSVAP